MSCALNCELTTKLRPLVDASKSCTALPTSTYSVFFVTAGLEPSRPPSHQSTNAAHDSTDVRPRSLPAYSCLESLDHAIAVIFRPSCVVVRFATSSPVPLLRPPPPPSSSITLTQPSANPSAHIAPQGEIFTIPTLCVTTRVRALPTAPTVSGDATHANRGFDSESLPSPLRVRANTYAEPVFAPKTNVLAPTSAHVNRTRADDTARRSPGDNTHRHWTDDDDDDDVTSLAAPASIALDPSSATLASVVIGDAPGRGDTAMDDM